jgi:hypothetical protein
MNKHHKCRQCGLSEGCPITWSNGRQTHIFCDNDCLKLWLDEQERLVLAEDVGPDFLAEMHRRAASGN